MGTVRRCGGVQAFGFRCGFSPTPNFLILRIYSPLQVNGGWEPSAVVEELILSPLLSLAFPARFDLSHVRFFIYSGAWFWIFFYCCFCARVVVILFALSTLQILVELRACTRVQLSVGSSTFVALAAAHHCQVGS